MMNENNHQNSSCSFAAEIVSYIYDEIGEREKSVFEAHLANCATCPEELADFMEIRFSVADWRETEFAPLSTPVTEIPFEHEQVRNISAVSGSWWSNLSQLFSLSPAWMTATTAMAALVICFGVFYAVFKYSGTVELAGIDNRAQKKPTVSPTSEISSNKNSEIVAVRDDNSNSSDKAPEPSKISEQPPKISNGNNSAATVIKVSQKKPKSVVQDAAGKPLNMSGKNSNKPTAGKNLPADNGQLPKLDNFDEDEDDSLRLAELFEDIDTLE